MGNNAYLRVVDSLSFYSKFSHLPPSLKEELEKFLETLISRSGDPLPEKKPVFGRLRGKIKLSPDFDAPLEDFKDYM